MIKQIAEVNYDNDTMFVVSHCDTTINGKHVVIDTFYRQDTLVIEKITYDKELEIIERLINKPDFGKGVCSVLILIFVVFSVWKKWKCKKEK